VGTPRSLRAGPGPFSRMLRFSWRAWPRVIGAWPPRVSIKSASWKVEVRGGFAELGPRHVHIAGGGTTGSWILGTKAAGT